MVSTRLVLARSEEMSGGEGLGEGGSALALPLPRLLSLWTI